MRPPFKQLTRHALAALSLALVAACEGGGGGDLPAASADPAGETFPAPSLSWRACEDHGTLQCATLLVPMDYAHPSGARLEIAVIKAPALDPSQRIGSLLYNPGGPGSSGLALLKDPVVMAQQPEALRQQYDLLSFDPRGVGDSAGVECAALQSGPPHEYPASRTELAAVMDVYALQAERCVQQIGPLALHLGSQSVIRDMERLRQALGDASLNMLAYSYGTRLAALYAQTYPQRVGRFVLDASMAPSASLSQIARDQAAATERNLQLLANVCATLRADCVASHFSEALRARVNDLKLRTETLQVLEFQLLLQLLRTAVNNPFTIPDIASPMRDYLAQPTLENLLRVGEAVPSAATAAPGFGWDGRTAYRAMMCTDHAERPDLDALQALHSELDAQSDVGAEWLLLDPAALCSGWPAARQPVPDIEVHDAPRMLVIGGDFDASTPGFWAEAMAEATGGHFLRSRHYGHISVFNGSSRCVDRAVEHFLLTGDLAQAPQVCAFDPP